MFTLNIQRVDKLYNQELSGVKGGRKEDEGGISLIGIDGIGDGIKGNAYLRIFTFKIRLSWW